MKKFITNIFIVLCAISLWACDSSSEKRIKTLEEKLVGIYAASNSEVVDRVNIIVTASNDHNYILAMNELGILSASQINTPEQKKVIKSLMTQLRYNLEDEDAANKKVIANKQP